ncbi:unnamed protein product [Musa hybrid cultivar]
MTSSSAHFGYFCSPTSSQPSDPVNSVSPKPPPSSPPPSSAPRLPWPRPYKKPTPHPFLPRSQASTHQQSSPPRPCSSISPDPIPTFSQGPWRSPRWLWLPSSSSPLSWPPRRCRPRTPCASPTATAAAPMARSATWLAPTCAPRPASCPRPSPTAPTSPRCIPAESDVSGDEESSQ